MSDQDSKTILKKIINNYVDYLFLLIDIEKLYIDNFISNKKKNKYKALLGLKISLFVAFCVFTLLDFINTIISTFLPLLILFILIFIDAYIAEALNNYNYTKFKKRIKEVKNYVNIFYLIVINKYLIDNANEINRLKVKVYEINEDLKYLYELLTSKSAIIINYKIIEIFGILITVILDIILHLINFYDYKLDAYFIFRIIFVCFLALYLFYLREFEYPAKISLDLDSVDDYTYEELLEFRYKKKLDKYRISLKNLIKSKFIFNSSKEKKINNILLDLIEYEKDAEKDDKVIFGLVK